MSAMKTFQDLLRRCLVNARPIPAVCNCQIVRFKHEWKLEAVPDEPPVISATGAIGAMIGILSARKGDYSCSYIDHEEGSNIYCWAYSANCPSKWGSTCGCWWGLRGCLEVAFESGTMAALSLDTVLL